jgi:acyl dehydratase
LTGLVARLRLPLVPVESLPAYHVKARNTSATSENAIHHDDVARRHGFPGALVPGVTIYAYLTRPLVGALGTGWLDRGTASVRFARPILDGDPVTVTATVTERDATVTRAELAADTERAAGCGVLSATLPAGRPTPVNLALYAERPLPAERPAATREHLAALPALGTPALRYDEAAAAEYLGRVDDDLPVYRPPAGRVHPAFYLQLANRALTANVAVSPWIHVSSAVRHLGPAHVGDTLRALGRVRSLYERKGREFVELDLVLIAGERARPVAHVLHTAIYRLPAP